MTPEERLKAIQEEEERLALEEKKKEISAFWDGKNKKYSEALLNNPLYLNTYQRSMKNNDGEIFLK